MRRPSQEFLQWLFMFRLVALVLTCLALAGCVRGGVVMKHPVTGKTVECGRYAWASSSLLSLTLESRSAIASTTSGSRVTSASPTRPAVAMTDHPRMRRTFRSELAARLGVLLPAIVIEPAPSLGDARNVFRR